MPILKLKSGIVKVIEASQPENKPRRGYRVVNDTLGDYFESGFKKFEIRLKKEADIFLRDIEIVAKRVKGVIFDRETYEPKILKDKASTLRKFNNTGEISDPIRTTLYMQDAHENYMPIVAEMDKLGYKIALNGKTPDITVRYGETAQPSGYEDVAIKFVKKNRNYPIYREVIILPGHNYHMAKEEEHKIYEAIRQYDGLLSDNPKLKEITKNIKGEMRKLSQKMYANAKAVDKEGMGKKENVAFSKENIVILRKNLMDLKTQIRAPLESKNLEKNEVNGLIRVSDDYSLILKVEKEIKALMEKYAPVV